MHKTFLSFIMICITSLLYGDIEYAFSAHNIGGGFIIFEPFDICGNTPSLLIPSTCSSFGSSMGMTGEFPHVKKLHLTWKYWQSIEHYKIGKPGIQGVDGRLRSPFFWKKMAERGGFEPSIILLVKSRLKRCFIPPFERKFLKF